MTVDGQASKEFRGYWPSLLGATLGCSFGVASIFFYSIGLFIRPLEAEFGWSRAGLSSAPALGAIALALVSPAAGHLIDRLGPRRVAAVSFAALGLGMLALSRSTASLPLYLAVVALIFVLAAGCSPVLFTYVVGSRFVRARGLALGIAIAGTGVGGAVIPKLVAPFIAGHGWRAAYVALGVAVLVAAPVILWLIGGRPQPRAIASGATDLPGHTVRQALASPAFWIIAFTLGVGGAGVTALSVHLAPMLADSGMDPGTVGSTVSLIGVTIIIGRVVTGFLVDRFPPHWVACLLFLAGGLASLLLLAGLAYAPVAALALGFAMGAEGDLLGFLTARYFGLKRFGGIFGWLYGLFTVGTAFGPLAAGFMFDATHTYRTSIMMAGSLLILASAGAVVMGRISPEPAGTR